MTEVNETKLHQFVRRMLGDMGAALGAALILIGDRLGLYKALAEAGPMTAVELAKATGTAERYVREWLAAQAASGYAEYDAVTHKFSLSPEQAAVFADENGPAFLAGFYDVVAATVRDEPKITEAFKTGKGVGWHEHHSCLFRGTERFFRTSYNHHVAQEWLPAVMAPRRS